MGHHLAIRHWDSSLIPPARRSGCRSKFCFEAGAVIHRTVTDGRYRCIAVPGDAFLRVGRLPSPNAEFCLDSVSARQSHLETLRRSEMMSIFKSEMDVMAAKPGAPRRRHSAQLKAEVVAECRQPGASVAAIALARGLNANLAHGWLSLSKAAKQSCNSVERPGDARFIELQLPPSMATAAPRRDIQIELPRGAMTVCVTWPTESASECATWMRELLR
jgi:transposase